jgi:hypothetical protein
VAGAPQWHPTGKVLYSTDYERGIDVIRYTGDTFVPPRSGDAPAPGQRPSSPVRAATGGRFAFRVRLKRVGKLEIRSGSRVVARARIRRRKRARVRGVALPGRYSWRAGRSRGRFTVRDQGLALPAGRVMDLRLR